MNVWAEVAEQRMQLADRVDALEPEQLDADSWCEGWRARGVLGRLVYLAEATQWRVITDMVRLGPSPDRALARSARILGELPARELTARLRAAAGGRFHVAGSPREVALGEVLVHGSHMLRPLGPDLDVDPPAALAANRTQVLESLEGPGVEALRGDG